MSLILGIPPTFVQLGLLSMVESKLADKEEYSGLHSRVSDLLSFILPEMKEMASTSPYNISNKPMTLPKPPLVTRMDSTDSITPMKSTQKRTKMKWKQSESTLGKTPPRNRFKKRSNSTSNMALFDTKSSTGSGMRARVLTRSISPQSGRLTDKVVNASPEPGSGVDLTFRLPLEVLILPLVKHGDLSEQASEEKSVGQWDFDLLSEEEVSVCADTRCVIGERFYILCSSLLS